MERPGPVDPGFRKRRSERAVGWEGSPGSVFFQWYEIHIPIADERFGRYLKSLKKPKKG
jgi:hypothetical protein